MQINKIYHQDCRITMRSMPDNFIDLVVTSPPYDNLRDYKGNVEWTSEVWKEILELLFAKMKQGGVVVWIVNDATINGSETGTSFKQVLYAMQIGFNLHDTMAFYKSTPMPQTNNRYEQAFEFMFVFSKGSPKTFNPIMKDNLRQGKYVHEAKKQDRASMRENSNSAKLAKKEFEYKKEGVMPNFWIYSLGLGGTSNDNLAFDHPAIFPEKLAADHIYSWSNEGDLVYVPFMGSGTVAKMAHIQNRNWIGSELASEYVELAYKRIAPYLAQKTMF